jgi:hypothetical protein
MTDTNTALAQRTLSDVQIKQRMELNAKSRFGLQEATPAQLNMIFLCAQKWRLDPITELTLYEGQPFIKLEGRLTLMRRHPDYHTFRCKPLKADERLDYGYESEDVVIECTIVTREHGEISERGCVRRAEIDAARKRAAESGRKPAPVGIYAPEIAEARAIKRASRAAFGQDIPDEDDPDEIARIVVQERADPERIARNSETYSRIYESEYGEEGTTSAVAEPPTAVEAAPAEAPNSAGAALVSDKNHPLWQEWLKAEKRARQAGFDGDTSNIHLGISESDLEMAIATLLADVDGVLS